VFTNLSHLQANEPHFANCKIRTCFLHFAFGDGTTDEVTGLVNVLKDLQNVDEINIVDWSHSDSCDPGFQHVNVSDIINAGRKQSDNEEEEGRGNEGKGNHESAKHNVALCYCMWITEAFEFDDIAVARTF